MTITRVGTTQKYADGWEKAFGGKRRKTGAAASPSKQAASSKSKKKSVPPKPGLQPTAARKRPAGKTRTAAGSRAAKK